MIERSDVDAVLRTILDPEMPINIVDLGLVHDVRIDSGHGIAHGCVYVTVDLLPTFVGCPALDVLRRDVCQRLSDLPDVLDVQVNWLFDPPWSTDRISEAGREALRAHGISTPGGSRPAGLVQLSRQGVPADGETDDAIAPVPCPNCGSIGTRRESAFGPTRCRMIYYCPACRNSFERLKAI